MEYILMGSATKKEQPYGDETAPCQESLLTLPLPVGLIERSLQPTPQHMLPTPPYSSTLALPVSATGGRHAVDGSVAPILLLAGIIVVGLLAALDLIVLVLVSLLLISLLILG